MITLSADSIIYDHREERRVLGAKLNISKEELMVVPMKKTEEKVKHELALLLAKELVNTMTITERPNYSIGAKEFEVRATVIIPKKSPV